MPEQPSLTDDIDTTKPHSSRVYDYLLGGKDWYLADQEAANALITTFPSVRTSARANRDFMHRTTRFLASEARIRQFLDIGTGIPTAPNLHQMAQFVDPAARIVYADNDPIVLRHAQALLRSTPQGRTAYVHGDLRDPAGILHSPAVLDTLDLTEPVALSLNAILHFLLDEDRPYEIVKTLMAALAPGSYLVISHGGMDIDRDTWEKIQATYASRGIYNQPRPFDEVIKFFDGLELIEPGLQVLHRWRPDTEPTVPDAAVRFYGGVARKP
jgi:hypothetical protein